MRKLEELKKEFAKRGYKVVTVNVPNRDKPGVHDEYALEPYDAKGEPYNLKDFNDLFELYYENKPIIEAEKKVAILNVPIMTQDGIYKKSSISLEKAKDLLGQKPFTSAIGHQGTAEVLSALLERDVKVNRIEFKQDIDTVAIILKMKGRIPEGVILTAEQMEEIGYDFFLVERLS